MVFRFGPDDGHVREGAVGDPHFFAVEDVLVSFFHGASEHAAGVGAELRFGEAEAADGLAGLEKGEPVVFLRLAAEGADRVHDERALHGDETAQAGIAALKFLSHEAIGDVGHARAAVALEVGAEEPEFAKLGNHVKGEGAFAGVLFDNGEDFVIDKLTRRLADQFFLVVQLGIKVDEIDTGK